MRGEVRDRSWATLKRGGFLVSILGEPAAETAEQFGVRAAGILVYPNGGQLAEIAALVEAGQIMPHVEAVYPLAEAARAHEHVQRGHTRGKVVLVDM